MNVKIVTKLDWPSFHYTATTIQKTLKARNKCTVHRWMNARPGGSIIFLGTVDNAAFKFLRTLIPKSKIIWYATTEGLSQIDDESKSIAQGLTIVAVSNFVKEMLEAIKIPVAGVLHHAVDMSDTRIDGPFYRKWKSKLKERRLILTVSANHQRKGLDKLLSAYGMIQEQDPDTFLIVHSERSGYHDLRKQSRGINPKSVWLTQKFGRMTRRQLNSLYKLCTIYVQPSLSEGFGLPVLEAFRFGKGVITVDAPPFNDIIRNGESGLLVPSSQVTWFDFKKSIRFKLFDYQTRNLAKAINQYLSHPKLQSAIESNVDHEKWQWDARALYPQLLDYFQNGSAKMTD